MANLRRACRTDANQGAITKALRDVGAWVIDMSRVGHGYPDVEVVHAGRRIWMEIKDGAKSPSRRELSDDEKDFHAKALLHGCPVHVVTSVEEALALVGVKS